LIERVIIFLNVIKQCNYLTVKGPGNISDKKSRGSVICDSYTGVAKDSKGFGVFAYFD
jgi:hypothetical protein